MIQVVNFSYMHRENKLLFPRSYPRRFSWVCCTQQEKKKIPFNGRTGRSGWIPQTAKVWPGSWLQVCLICHHKQTIPTDTTTHSWKLSSFLCSLSVICSVHTKLSRSTGSLPLPFSFPLAEWMYEWPKELFLLCCNQFSLWPHDRRWQHIVPEFLYVVFVRTESTSVVPILISNLWEGEKLVVWSIWFRESRWITLATPGYHDMTVGTGGVQGTVFAKQILGRKSYRFLPFLKPLFFIILVLFQVCPVPDLRQRVLVWSSWVMLVCCLSTNGVDCSGMRVCSR